MFFNVLCLDNICWGQMRFLLVDETLFCYKKLMLITVCQDYCVISRETSIEKVGKYGKLYQMFRSEIHTLVQKAIEFILSMGRKGKPSRKECSLNIGTDPKCGGRGNIQFYSSF